MGKDCHHWSQGFACRLWRVSLLLTVCASDPWWCHPRGKKAPKRLGTGQSPLRENKHNLPFSRRAAALPLGGPLGPRDPTRWLWSRPTDAHFTRQVLGAPASTQATWQQEYVLLRVPLNCTIFLISCHIVAQYNVKLFLFFWFFVINVFLFQYPLFKVLCLFLPKMKLHSLMLSHGSSFREGGWKGAAFRDCWIIQKHLTSSMPNMSPGPGVQRTVWVVHLSHPSLCLFPLPTICLHI